MAVIPIDLNAKNCLFVIDGEPFEYVPGHTRVEVLREIQTSMTVRKTGPEEFEDRSVFMSMFNDIDWTQKESSNECFSKSDG